MFLCLDFDGVVVDGVDECLIVSWVAWHKQKTPKDPKTVLKKIPTSFKQMFRLYRNYARYDGHFIVPYILKNNAKIAIEKQLDFQDFFSTIDKETVDNFTTIFQKTRQQFRDENPNAWFGLHSLYSGIEAVFGSNQQLFIVSGKDKESICAICDENKISISPENVFGGLKSKVEVLKLLYKQANEQKVLMVFCDDNLLNVLESKSLGISTIWAGWGYKTQEHLDTAKNKSIDAYTVPELLKSIEKIRFCEQ